MAVNKKYKDSVFTLLFSEEQKLIELYNAIEGTDYTLDTEIKINTLDNALFMDRKNDISFTIDGKLIILVEHQASINNNMPLRFLLYIARIYEKMIDEKAIYKSKQIPLPTPEFVVLYNGDANYPEEKTLKLSDAFMEYGITGINLELMVKVININYGKSTNILKKSRTLEEYSYFMNLAKRFRKQGESLESAIELAVKECIKENVLRNFLESNGSEVVNMLFTEFNLEDAKEVWKEEGREEGRKEGRKEEKRDIAVSLFGILDDEIIAQKTGLTLDEIQRLKESD